MRDYFVNNVELIKFYSPYNIFREIEGSKIFSSQKNEFAELIQQGAQAEIEVAGENYLFIFKKLAWDSVFFKKEIYKIYVILSENGTYLNLPKAIECFIEKHLPKSVYSFIELPSEDIACLQALGGNKFKLIESRVNYYKKDLHSFSANRFSVKEATKDDVSNLKRVAATMRNKYDRFHADSGFDTEIADSYLSTYIENSINGFADYVMIPNEVNLPSDSFLTANYLKDTWADLDHKVSKMVLSAVSSETNKGWYTKLISEMIYHLRDKIGAELVFLNTQSTNRAVITTWEKHGFKYGNSTHVFSIQTN